MQNSEWYIGSIEEMPSGSEYCWLVHTDCDTGWYYSSSDNKVCIGCKDLIPEHIRIQMRLLLGK